MSGVPPDELDALVHEASEWLRIPSISAGARNDAALAEAAQWARARVLAAGGQCELVPTDGSAPLVVGELPASGAANGDAPTIMIYGHYDVQDPGEENLWSSPPFQPVIRDGRLYARGSSDDKGNFLPLLHVACAMAAAGELPVNVRVLIEGAEETGHNGVNRWVEADERGADAAIVFDTGMVDADTPALTVATRGMIMAQLEVRAGQRNAHSGVYGGAALNAFHALHRTIGAVLPGPDGRLPDVLRAGIAPPTPEEEAGWEALPPGAVQLAKIGARPADPRAAEEFNVRTTADASLDVHYVAGGQARTIVPAVAQAVLSVRLAPGQVPDEIADALEAKLRGALPDGAELDLKLDRASPSRFDPAEPALQIAAGAIARATGTQPAIVRSGGSLPILVAFSERGIPAIVSGFGLPLDNIHAPDESFPIASLEHGRRTARALYEDLAGLR